MVEVSLSLFAYTLKAGHSYRWTASMSHSTLSRTGLKCLQTRRTSSTQIARAASSSGHSVGVVSRCRAATSGLFAVLSGRLFMYVAHHIINQFVDLISLLFWPLLLDICHLMLMESVFMLIHVVQVALQVFARTQGQCN